jgi:predicted esterase
VSAADKITTEAGVPNVVIPHSTTKGLTVDQARDVAERLRNLADAYDEAANKAGLMVAEQYRAGYDAGATIWRDVAVEFSHRSMLTVTCRGYARDADA